MLTVLRRDVDHSISVFAAAVSYVGLTWEFLGSRPIVYGARPSTALALMPSALPGETFAQLEASWGW